MRYIDAEKLKDEIRKEFPALGDRIAINTIINSQPTADVVEVVRCKDCKHNPHNTTDDACPFVEESGCYVKYFPEDDGFCKWGERRDND